jgi:hypothetical protein
VRPIRHLARAAELGVHALQLGVQRADALDEDLPRARPAPR